jgi:hypothetical protein
MWWSVGYRWGEQQKMEIGGERKKIALRCDKIHEKKKKEYIES